MKHLLIIAALLCWASDCHSQVCYYPLAKGNVWDYGASYLQWRVMGDTLLPDGRIYSVLQETHYYQKKCLRQQGDSVFSGATLYYDFTRMPGDTLWQTGNSFKYVSALGDTTIFGRNLRWWEFTRIVFVGTTAGWDVEIVVDSVGMVYYWESYDFHFQPWALRGAIIDGKQYGTISSLEENPSPEMPAAFFLSQNYPNPFNPTTTIRYELPKSSLVRLSVYDVLGREVSVLVNERKNAGVHEVEFDATELSSGVYLYRLWAGDYISTKKLLVLR
jgi:hypothetical protein